MENDLKPPKTKPKVIHTPEERDASGPKTGQRWGLPAADLRHAQICARALLVLLVVFNLLNLISNEDKMVFHNAQTLLPLWACPSGLNTGRGRSQDLSGPHSAYPSTLLYPSVLNNNTNIETKQSIFYVSCPDMRTAPKKGKVVVTKSVNLSEANTAPKPPKNRRSIENTYTNTITGYPPP